MGKYKSSIFRWCREVQYLDWKFSKGQLVLNNPSGGTTPGIPVEIRNVIKQFDLYKIARVVTTYRPNYSVGAAPLPDPVTGTPRIWWLPPIYSYRDKDDTVPPTTVGFATRDPKHRISRQGRTITFSCTPSYLNVLGSNTDATGIVPSRPISSNTYCNSSYCDTAYLTNIKMWTDDPPNFVTYDTLSYTVSQKWYFTTTKPIGAAL